MFPGGSQNLIIARDDDFKDAMSATGMAGSLNCPILPVSYTHLDVYKRQPLECSEGVSPSQAANDLAFLNLELSLIHI